MSNFLRNVSYANGFRRLRITVRRALQILSDEMLVVRRQGSGTYVSGRTVEKNPTVEHGFQRLVIATCARLDSSLGFLGLAERNR